MEVILGVVALQAGLITEALFVALVLMALLTTLMSGAALERYLRRSQSATAERRGLPERLVVAQSGAGARRRFATTS